MRLRVLAQLLLVGLPLHANAFCKGSDPGLPLSHYDGTIGASGVRVSLELDSGAVAGLFFYLSDLKDINIRGRIVDGSKLILDAVDATNKVVARFDGTFPTADPRNHVGGSLECEVIVGMWHSLDSTIELPVYLLESDEDSGNLHHQYLAAGIQNDELINRSARRLQEAVKQNDRQTVASLIRYPINVGVGPPHCLRIRNEAQLLKNYDRIFFRVVRDAIVSGIPKAMFARDDGVLLADGVVYIGADGLVVQLNACNGRRHSGTDRGKQ